MAEQSSSSSSSDEVDFFLQPDERRDFALVVEGTKVFVSREYLACHSPVLAKIFYPQGEPFKQPEDGLVMKEKKLDDLLIFLHVICPSPTPTQLNESNVAPLLAYADEYDVGVMRERCVAFMAKQLRKGRVTGEARIDYLRLATLFNLKELQKQLVPLVAQLSFDLIKPAHETLPTSVLAAVYQSKALHQSAALDSLPKTKNEFICYKCNQPCAIINSTSACCGRVVRVNQTALEPQSPLPQCTFTCSKCDDDCLIGTNKEAACCHWPVYVNQAAAKCAKCKDKPNALDCTCRYDDFSVDLLAKVH